MSSTHDSVTEWLSDLKKSGDPIACQRIWRRYIAQLVRVAHRRLGDAPRRVADEEDVAVTAFASFCRGVEHERFARLNDRDDLWQVLVVLTERKALNQVRHERALRRGGGDVSGRRERDDSPGAADQMAQFADGRPTPDFAAEVSDQLRRLLTQLDDPQLCQIVLRKLEGYTNREIATQLGVSLRSVERRLALIRGIWTGV